MTHDEKREAIARIIDPERWANRDKKTQPQSDPLLTALFAKVDAILALTPPPATSEIGVEYRRGLEDAAKVVGERAAEYRAAVVGASMQQALALNRVADELSNQAAAIRSLSAAPTPQAEQGDGWMPIETAPGSKPVIVARKTQFDGCQIAIASKHKRIWCAAGISIPQPTHWRPLPRPPAEPDTSGYAEWANDAGKGDGA